MQFDSADMDTILEATGENITITDAGGSRIIRGKFRKNFASVSPYESNTGILLPSFLCKTSDLSGATSRAVYTVGGVSYRLDGKPEEQPSGFTLVKLGKISDPANTLTTLAGDSLILAGTAGEVLTTGN
jgi:hypothetical protein